MPRRRRFWNYPRPNKGLVQRWLPSWRIVVGSMLGLGALGAGLFVAAYATTEIPDNLDEVKHQVTTVYYANGNEIGTISDGFKREIVDYSTLPEYVGGAVVASEDSTFWTNPGVDVRGIARAAFNNLKGGSRQGASTLTQQYVERYYLDTTTSYAGKLREAIIALKVARTQPKEEVLGNYLNTIYWGRGTYGIQAAAKEYFGKDAAELTYSESAMLAGIIPSPVNWDPSVNLEQAQLRWERSIQRLYDQGYITPEEYQNAEFPKFRAKKEARNTQGGQKGYLIDAVKKELIRSGRFTDEDWTRGLQITTTIKPKLQKAAVDIVDAIPEDASKNLRASIVSIDPSTGAIVTLYGGADYVTQSLSTATQDVVQAGSTFKPFTLIGALEKGHTLDETFDGNSPKTFPEANNGEDWEVNNFGLESYGQVDLAEATANSVNTAYAELNLEIGPETTADVAVRAGIRETMNDKPTVPSELSNVLGTASVYPIDLARAYATLAAQGYKTTPHVVQKVETLSGEQIYQEQTSSEQVFKPDVMAASTYAMTKVVEEGSGRTAQELGRPVAGKTGTSQNNRSAWFAGYVPQLATVVGLRQYEKVDLEAGIMQGQAPIDAFGGYGEITGGSWPVRAWTDFMAVATEGMEIKEFPEFTPPTPSFSPSPTPSPSETEFVEVPNVVGMDIAKATRELEKLGLNVGAPVAQDSDQPRGTVLAQSSTDEVPVGSTITLTVSTGQTEQTVVPEVVGMTRTSAEQALRDAGLRSSVREEERVDVEPGTVIQSDPGGGATVEPGSTVTLIVAKAPVDAGGGNGNGNGNGGEPSPSPTPSDEDDGGLFGG